MELKQIQTNDPQIIAAIGRLRAEVWRDEPEIRFHEFGDADCWTDTFDHDAIHWAVYAGDQIVAAARLSLHSSCADVPYAHVFEDCHVRASGKVASINRLIVKKAFRGLGIARALDLARLGKARELGASTVLALPVGDQRVKALAALGYVLLVGDLDPKTFGLSLANARVGVMAAPLTAGFCAIGAEPARALPPNAEPRLVVGTR